MALLLLERTMEKPEHDSVPSPMTVSAPPEMAPEGTEPLPVPAQHPAEIEPPSDPGYGFGV